MSDTMSYSLVQFFCSILSGVTEVSGRGMEGYHEVDILLRTSGDFDTADTKSKLACFWNMLVSCAASMENGLIMLPSGYD